MNTSLEFLDERGWREHKFGTISLYCHEALDASGEGVRRLRDWVVDRIEAFETEQAGRGRRNFVANAPVGEENWFVKQYHHGGMLAGDGDVDYSAPDRFFGELEATLKARDAGLQTPVPRFLAIEEADGSYRGYYASRYCETARPLSAVLRLTGDQQLLTKAADSLVALHEAGIDHRDYHVKNLLVQDNEILVSDFDPVTIGSLSKFVRQSRVRRFNRSLLKYGFLESDAEVFREAYRRKGSGVSFFFEAVRPALSLSNSISDLTYWARDRELNPVDLEKILIRAPNWLGDTVMSLPLIEGLDQHESVGRIDVAVRDSLSTVYECHESVERVWELPNDKTMSLPDEISEQRYGSLLVVPKSFRTGYQAFGSGIPRRVGFATQGRSLFLTDRIPLRSRDRSEHHARLYRRLTKGLIDPDRPIDPPSLRCSEETLDRVRSEVGDPFITIHPGSAYGPAKRWPPEQFAACLKQLLSERSEFILALGVEDETDLADEVLGGLDSERIINKVGETTLEEAMAYLSLSRGTIANDSGIMHLSAALGTPTLGIFGSSDPSLTHPIGERTDYVYESVECSPCFETHCPLSEDRYKCLTRVSPDRVFDQFRQIVS